MKKKRYTIPQSKSVELSCESMLAMSKHDEEGDGWQLSNKQERPGWNADAWNESQYDGSTEE